MAAITVWDRLAGPFDPQEIQWRPGATSNDRSTGLALAYIDARQVMERLDMVLGASNWSDRYHQCGNITVCELSIRLPGSQEWLLKSDGAGQADGEEAGGNITDPSKRAAAVAMAAKGTISDALKRAAVKFGVGRYLYYLPGNWWYPLNQYKQFTPEACHKMANDLGAWQREWFRGLVVEGEVRGGNAFAGPTNGPAQEPPRQQQQQQQQQLPPPANRSAASGGSVYKDFMKALEGANETRRQENLPLLTGRDVLAELRAMNYMTDGIQVKRWPDLWDAFGDKGLTDLTRELMSRPCLIGQEVPF